MIYLVEVTARDPVSGVDQVLRFSSDMFITGPGDSPPHTGYRRCLQTPANFERHLYQSGHVGGQSSAAFGVIELINCDGDLDFMAGLAVDGRRLVVRCGPDRGVYPDDYPPLLTGIVARVDYGLKIVTIILRDRQAEVADRPLHAATYGGTNQLPLGVDGTADDIKGQVKPILLGPCRQVGGVQVNSSLLIQQLADHPGVTPLAVYDRLLENPVGLRRATVADLQATAPTAGHWDWYSGDDGCFIRLGWSPIGTVTVDADGPAITMAVALRRFLTTSGGLTDADLDLGSFSALAAQAPADLCFFSADQQTVGEAMDTICASGGGWWSVSRDGRFSVGRLTAPNQSTDPDVIITLSDIMDGGLSAMDGRDMAGSIPAWRVSLGWGRCWTVMAPKDVAGGVDTDLSAYAGQIERRAVAADQSIIDLHPLARELTASTLIVDAAAAESEAQRRLSLYGVRRSWWLVKIQAGAVDGLDLGKIVQLDVDRYGLSSGRFVITGLGEDYGLKKISVEVWG